MKQPEIQSPESEFSELFSLQEACSMKRHKFLYRRRYSLLLYSKFCVLNELNNVKIDNRHLSRDTKKKIIDTLFKNKKKVTIAMLKEFLKHEGISVDIITGLPDGNNFSSNMVSYIDMKKILKVII